MDRFPLANPKRGVFLVTREQLVYFWLLVRGISQPEFLHYLDRLLHQTRIVNIHERLAGPKIDLWKVILQSWSIHVVCILEWKDQKRLHPEAFPTFRRPDQVQANR